MSAGLEIRIGHAPLPTKLDAIAAALAAVREAHRDTMPSKTWCQLYEAQQLLAIATVSCGTPATRSPLSGATATKSQQPQGDALVAAGSRG